MHKSHHHLYNRSHGCSNGFCWQLQHEEQGWRGEQGSLGQVRDIPQTRAQESLPAHCELRGMKAASHKPFSACVNLSAEGRTWMSLITEA